MICHTGIKTNAKATEFSDIYVFLLNPLSAKIRVIRVIRVLFWLLCISKFFAVYCDHRIQNKYISYLA